MWSFSCLRRDVLGEHGGKGKYQQNYQAGNKEMVNLSEKQTAFSSPMSGIRIPITIVIHFFFTIILREYCNMYTLILKYNNYWSWVLFWGLTDLPGMSTKTPSKTKKEVIQHKPLPKQEVQSRESLPKKPPMSWLRACTPSRCWSWRFCPSSRSTVHLISVCFLTHSSNS